MDGKGDGSDAHADATIEVDPTGIRRMLSMWQESRTLLLDMRSDAAFHTRRLEGAVNLPRETMSGRLHELPPRSKPLAVVLDPAPGTCEDVESWYRAQLAWFGADFKGNPWTMRGCIVGDDALFIDHAPAAGFPVAQGVVTPMRRGRLWEPSDNVARWLPKVEARMGPSSWGAGGLLLEGAGVGQSGGDGNGDGEGGEGDAGTEQGRPLCIDLGCGAGRDAVYAALRGWRVLALDSDAKGLARCGQLATVHGVRHRVAPVRVDLEKTAPKEVFDAVSRTPWGSLVRGCVDWNAGAGMGKQGAEMSGCGPVRAVVAVRFLQRRLARSLPTLLPTGAAVLWFHFMRGAELTAVGRPNKAKDLLEVGELRQVFESEPGWDIVVDDAVTLPDGRPVSEFVAVRDRRTE